MPELRVSVSKFTFVENGPSIEKWTEMAENPAELHFETHAIQTRLDCLLSHIRFLKGTVNGIVPF